MASARVEERLNHSPSAGSILKRTLNLFGFLLELPAELALVGTLFLSFSLWMLWGALWFPVIDWLFERIAL